MGYSIESTLKNLDKSNELKEPKRNGNWLIGTNNILLNMFIMLYCENKSSCLPLSLDKFSKKSQR